MADSIRREHRFTVTPEHLTLDPRVGDRAHRLWCRLDRFAGSRQSATSYRETLSIEMDCSLSSVDRALEELASAGWLRIERQPGGASSYTLTVAPQKTVERLAEKARRERMERWGNQRRRKESAQVSDGGVVTHDDTHRSGDGVVTSDEGVSSPMTTGVVTHDAHKEAGRTRERTLAVAADAAPTGDGLFEAPATATPAKGKQAPKPPDPLRQHADRLCDPWWQALPIKPAGKRAYPNVVDLVMAQIQAGRSDEDIAFALARCGVSVAQGSLNLYFAQRDRERAERTGDNIRSLPPAQQAPKAGMGAWNRRVVLPGPDASGAA